MLTADKSGLLKKIQEYSFALYDTILFLDAYPDNRTALENYRKYKKVYEEAAALYEANYGPLTIKGVQCPDKWTWATDPWPWELAANL